MISKISSGWSPGVKLLAMPTSSARLPPVDGPSTTSSGLLSSGCVPAQIDTHSGCHLCFKSSTTTPPLLLLRCGVAQEGVLRSAAKLKLGYYPLVQAEAERIRKFLQFHGEASVLDPCTGTGAALRTITQDAAALRYGIELDSYRAGEAKRALDHVIHGSVFEVHAPVESFSLLYLNPPFDFEIGEGRNQRMERIFLEHAYRWLKQSGVLVMIAPFDRVYECKTVLTSHFRDKAVYRLTESEAIKYKQVVVFGIRRTRQERERLNDHAVQEGNRGCVRSRCDTKKFRRCLKLRIGCMRCSPACPPSSNTAACRSTSLKICWRNRRLGCRRSASLTRRRRSSPAGR